MRSGASLTQLVEFPSGLPDGNVLWTLLDEDGTEIATGSVTPAADAASVVINISGVHNTLASGELAGHRELSWSFAVDGLLQSARVRYRLEAFLPFGVSEPGVRRKLGIEQHEIDDASIDLVSAYCRFRTTVGAELLDAATGVAAMAAGHAIEALAAISLIPSLQISLAAKESSGTNQFARAKIDWEMVRGQLDAYVLDGYDQVNPNVDPAADYGAILIAVVREDPVTGETS